LQVTPSNLSFTATLLQPNPPGQTVTLNEVGHCSYPVTWTASVVDPSSHTWLSISKTSGSDNGSGSTITVNVNATGILLGVYTGQIMLSATDNGGNKLQNSPQDVSVTLTVAG